MSSMHQHPQCIHLTIHKNICKTTSWHEITRNTRTSEWHSWQHAILFQRPKMHSLEGYPRNFPTLNSKLQIAKLLESEPLQFGKPLNAEEGHYREISKLISVSKNDLFVGVWRPVKVWGLGFRFLCLGFVVAILISLVSLVGAFICFETLRIVALLCGFVWLKHWLKASWKRSGTYFFWLREMVACDLCAC